MISDPLTLANVFAKNGRLFIKIYDMKKYISSRKCLKILDFSKGSFWIRTRSFCFIKEALCSEQEVIFIKI
jgi:hypothetical protein